MKFKKNLSLAIALALGLQTGAAVPQALAEETAAVKVGLIAEADDASGWSNMYEDVAAVSAVNENGESWARLATDSSVFAWASKIGAMKFDLGDKKIKFEDDKIIKIKTRFRAKTADGVNGRMAMHYNLPEETVTALADGETLSEKFSFAYNHAILWELQGVGTQDNSYVAYANGITNNQTLLGWVGRTGKFNGEDTITVTVNLDKGANTAKFVFESDGNPTVTLNSNSLGYCTNSEYLENIIIDNVVEPTEYIDVDYIKVWNLPKDSAEDEPTTSTEDWNISDINVSDNVNGVVSFAGAPENAEISVTKRGVNEDESTAVSVADFEVSYNNGITTLNFAGLDLNSKYTVKVSSTIVRSFTFESKYEGKTGLIATADTASDWSVVNDNGAVSEIVDDDGTTWARLTPNGTFDAERAIPEMKLELGDNKIRFEDDKIIRIETRLRAKGDTGSRAAMRYNMPATRVVAADGTERAFSSGWNHSVLWELYSSASAPADFGYPGSIIDDGKQNGLGWNHGNVSAAMNGEDIVMVTIDLDKKANKAEFKYEYNGVKAKSTSTELGYGTLSEYLENITISNLVKQFDYADVDYVKVWNLEKSKVLDIDFAVASDVGNIDDCVEFIYSGEMTNSDLADKFSVTDENGEIVYSSAALENGKIKLTIAAPEGNYTVNVNGSKSFKIVKTTDTSDLVDIGRPVIKNGTYDVDVVEDYVINYKTAETAAASVISVEGMQEGADYTIVRDAETVTVEFADALDYQTVYKVTIDGVDYLFKTATDGKTLFSEDFSMPNALTRFNAEKLGVTDDMEFASITADKKLMLKNLGGGDMQGKGYRLVTKDSDDWSNYELSVKSMQTAKNVQESFHLREYYAIRRWANFAGCGNELAVTNTQFDENGVACWLFTDLEGSWNQYVRPYTSDEVMGKEYTLKASVVGNNIEYGLYDADTFIQHTNADGEAVPVNENGKYYAVTGGEKKTGGVAFGTNFTTTPTYLDDITVTDLNLAFLAKDVKNNNGKFTIEFTMPVDASTLDEITIDGADCYKMLSADKKTVTVALKNAADGRYTVAVGNVRAADGTGVTHTKTFDITVKNAEANYINVAKDVAKAVISTNMSKELAEIGAKLYVAAYDIGGRLIGVASAAAQDKAEVSVDAADTVKVFLWNSDNAPIDFE